MNLFRTNFNIKNPFYRCSSIYPKAKTQRSLHDHELNFQRKAVLIYIGIFKFFFTVDFVYDFSPTMPDLPGWTIIKNPGLFKSKT